jgi:hypothetical protein
MHLSKLQCNVKKNTFMVARAPHELAQVDDDDGLEAFREGEEEVDAMAVMQDAMQSMEDRLASKEKERVYLQRLADRQLWSGTARSAAYFMLACATLYLHRQELREVEYTAYLWCMWMMMMHGMVVIMNTCCSFHVDIKTNGGMDTLSKQWQRRTQWSSLTLVFSTFVYAVMLLVKDGIDMNGPLLQRFKPLNVLILMNTMHAWTMFVQMLYGTARGMDVTKF